MNINETIANLRDSFTNYTLTITEMLVEGDEDSCCECGCCSGDGESIPCVAVRMVGDDCAVTVIKEDDDDGDIVLENTVQETFDRLVCLSNDEEYNG
jgi:hypothetical protein